MSDDEAQDAPSEAGETSAERCDECARLARQLRWARHRAATWKALATRPNDPVTEGYVCR